MKHMILLLAMIFPALFSYSQTQQNCLSFDGTDDYVSCDLPSIFTNLANNDFTFETWVKLNSSSASRVFYAQLDANNFATVLVNNALLFYVKISGITYSCSAPLPPTGEWVHIAAAWNTSVLMPYIYVNGVRQTTSPGGASSTGADNKMTLGSRTDGAQLFNGEMDEVRIWNTARNECEIRSMMHSIPAGDEVNLIDYYNFNRGIAGGTNPTFTVLPDLVGVNSGALMNFALGGATSNWVSSTVPLTGIGAQNPYETTDSVAICEGDSYNFGTQTLTAAGVYQETFTSVHGCDSVVTLQLTVHAVHMPPVVASACTSYSWAQTGETYLTSGIYTDTLTSSFGCDSILALDLTITQPTASSLQISTCESYTWAQTGEMYTVSGLYNDTIPNATGCDSVITLDLTILQPTGSTWPVSVCTSYEWIQTGETYTASGLYYDTIQNAVGCDSVITLDLTILEPTTSNWSASACGSYYWEQTGLIYSFSGLYRDTITNAAGCDSVITLSLNIDPLPEATIVHNGQGTLSANTSGDVAEWIDCSNGQTIPGQQGQNTFTPAENGSYAVIVENSVTFCRDTSDCFTVNFVGLQEHNLIDLRIYPNPAKDRVTVLFAGETADLTLRDALGKLVWEQIVKNGEEVPLATLEPGIYLFTLETAYGADMERIVKQ